MEPSRGAFVAPGAFCEAWRVFSGGIGDAARRGESVDGSDSRASIDFPNALLVTPPRKIEWKDFSQRFKYVIRCWII